MLAALGPFVRCMPPVEAALCKAHDFTGFTARVEEEVLRRKTRARTFVLGS